jgi:hypothetical protein
MWSGWPAVGAGLLFRCPRHGNSRIKQWPCPSNPKSWGF